MHKCKCITCARAAHLCSRPAGRLQEGRRCPGTTDWAAHASPWARRRGHGVEPPWAGRSAAAGWCYPAPTRRSAHARLHLHTGVPELTHTSHTATVNTVRLLKHPNLSSGWQSPLGRQSSGSQTGPAGGRCWRPHLWEPGRCRPEREPAARSL